MRNRNLLHGMRLVETKKLRNKCVTFRNTLPLRNKRNKNGVDVTSVTKWRHLIGRINSNRA